LKDEALPNHWISALFKKFQARYGHKWTSAIEGIEETAVNEWSVGLSGVTGDEIRKGLEVWTESWPPSLPEFKVACKNAGVNEFGLDYVPEYYRPQIKENSRLLSSKQRDANREKSKEYIQAMKDAIK